MQKLNQKSGELVVWFMTLCVILFSLLNNNGYHLQVLTWVCLNTLLAISLRFVLMVGEVNLATVAFFGIGAYISAILTVQYHFSIFLSLLIGGSTAAIISLFFGIITFRLKGPYFLLVSFAFAEVMRLIYIHSQFFGGTVGIIGITPGISWYPTLTVIVTVLLCYLLYYLERSDLGKAFKAIESHDLLAQVVGIPVMWVKVFALFIASFTAGIAGGLFSHFNAVITPDDFSFMTSIFALAYVLIGGKHHILGVFIGALILTLLTEIIRSYGPYEPLIYGLALIVAMLFMPNGIWGWLDRLKEKRFTGMNPKKNEVNSLNEYK